MSDCNCERDIANLRYDLSRGFDDLDREIQAIKRETDAAIGALAQAIDKIRSEGHCEQWYEERADE